MLTKLHLQEHGIPLIKVDSNMKLGEWAGLCKIDQEGKARKVVKCSAAVVSWFQSSEFLAIDNFELSKNLRAGWNIESFVQVRDWGSQGAANDVLQDYLKANK